MARITRGQQQQQQQEQEKQRQEQEQQSQRDQAGTSFGADQGPSAHDGADDDTFGPGGLLASAQGSAEYTRLLLEHGSSDVGSGLVDEHGQPLRPELVEAVAAELRKQHTPQQPSEPKGTPGTGSTPTVPDIQQPAASPSRRSTRKRGGASGSSSGGSAASQAAGKRKGNANGAKDGDDGPMPSVQLRASNPSQTSPLPPTGGAFPSTAPWHTAGSSGVSPFASSSQAAFSAHSQMQQQQQKQAFHPQDPRQQHVHQYRPLPEHGIHLHPHQSPHHRQPPLPPSHQHHPQPPHSHHHPHPQHLNHAQQQQQPQQHHHHHSHPSLSFVTNANPILGPGVSIPPRSLRTPPVSPRATRRPCSDTACRTSSKEEAHRRLRTLSLSSTPAPLQQRRTVRRSTRVMSRARR